MYRLFAKFVFLNTEYFTTKSTIQFLMLYIILILIMTNSKKLPISNSFHSSYVLDSYLGNQRASYNHDLSFSLRIGAESVRISAHDVILEGAGQRLSVPITEQGNPIPSHRVQNYRFQLYKKIILTTLLFYFIILF